MIHWLATTDLISGLSYHSSRNSLRSHRGGGGPIINVQQQPYIILYIILSYTMLYELYVSEVQIISFHINSSRFFIFFPSNRGVKSGPWWLDVTPKYPRYFPTMFDGNPSLSISIHANHHVFSREFLSTTPLQSHHPCMYRMYTLFDC